ncbi:MAG: FecR domain-containing protein [Fimbriiglobus sp.]
MTTDPFTPTPELSDLCAAAVENRLTPGQVARLEILVLGNPNARRFYADYAGIHAALAWSGTDPAVLSGSPPAIPPSAAPRARRPRLALWAVAASLLIAAGVFTTTRPIPVSAGPQSVATLVDAGGCKWGGGTLPTADGARLIPGRLRLAEGVARISFDTGAEVQIEGPADLEVVAADRCVLHDGRLVAKVPPPAVGFRVDTPAAELTDFGTEFGVNVRDGQTSEVQVFEGIVDGRPRESATARRMTTGQSLRFGRHGATAFDPTTEEAPAISPPQTPHTETVRVSTATGRGKDAYVFFVNSTPPFHSDSLILVKNTVPGTGPNGKTGSTVPYNRKGYLGMDLRSVAGRKVLDATLTFAMAPTKLGFASECPDATFAVYGLTDEQLDGWDEAGIAWENAPANRDGGADVDPTKATLLGKFQVPQGVNTGTRSIDGRPLADFLNADTNKTASFILVRETVGSGRQDYVHGFPNRRHPTLPPPTLILTVEQK